MKIKTALILCAGRGRRLNPLTLKKPKPLLELSNITLLENTINLIKKLGIKKIFLNTFYLKDQVKNYLNDKNFNIAIDIIEDGEEILDTGGGIRNMIHNSEEKDFLIFNPDTIWNSNYLKNIKQMNEFFENNNIKNILLVVNKKLNFVFGLQTRLGSIQLLKLLPLKLMMKMVCVSGQRNVVLELESCCSLFL